MVMSATTNNNVVLTRNRPSIPETEQQPTTHCYGDEVICSDNLMNHNVKEADSQTTQTDDTDKRVGYTTSPINQSDSTVTSDGTLLPTIINDDSNIKSPSPNTSSTPNTIDDTSSGNNPVIATRKINSHSGSICYNCKTETTPLWRRDEHGNTLCNACGLFLKLHGTSRPINLKTSVIKSRNRKAHNNNNNKNFNANKMFRGNFQLNNPFQLHSASMSQPPKQYARSVEFFPLRDSESVKRFKTSLTRDQVLGRIEYPPLVPKSNQYIKPHLIPKLEQYESEKMEQTGIEKQRYRNMRRYSFPTEIENGGSIKKNPLLIPSVIDPTVHKAYPTGKPIPTPPNYRNGDNSKSGSSSSLGSDSEFSKLNTTSNSHIALSQYLSNEEDVIKLRTRVKELELVTDLYRDYIFRINEKCQDLEAVLQSTYNQN